MTEQELLAAAGEAIVAADEDKALEIARQAVDLGLDPIKVINEVFPRECARSATYLREARSFCPR
jgi:methanogenic corrinoid protein MtbC1